MSSERRVIRPYSGMVQFQFILNSWRLQCGSSESGPDENMLVRSDAYRSDPISLVCAPDDDTCHESLLTLRQACDAIGLDPSQIEILVVASTPYLRLADVVHRRQLNDDDALATRIPIDPGTARAIHSPVAGCEIVAYVCLADDVQPAPLLPHRRGTWLAQVKFRMSTDLGVIGFTPRPLTAELREELGLDESAVRYVRVDRDSLLDAEFDDAVELFVDEELLGHLNRAAQSPASRAFQRQLFTDVVGAVAHAAAARTDAGELGLPDVEGTLLEHIIDAYAGKRDAAKESQEQHRTRRENALNTMLKQPGVFVANFEGRLGAPKDDLTLAIGGMS